MNKGETITNELIITVTRKGVDTGIWHIGADSRELITKAQQSVSDVFGDGKRVLRVADRDRNNAAGTLVVNHTGANFRWVIAATS
jgi:hypothetical protein